MTSLAVRLACLEIPVDPTELFFSENEMLFLWLEKVCDRVEAAHRDAQRRTKK